MIGVDAAMTAPAGLDAEDDGRGAVCLGYVCEDKVTVAWHHSLISLLGHDMAGAGRLVRGGWAAVRCGTDGLQEARNRGVKAFLGERTAEWLLWLDTDAGFPPDLVERLIEAADPAERPIVGALAFSYREDSSDGLGGWRCRPTPTIFDWRKLGDEMGFLVRWGYPPDTLVRCAGTGSHAILIHRSVFKRIAERYGEHWYDRIDNTSTHSRVSEDLSFCMRANTVGVPIYVHTGVRTSHQKTIWLAEDDYGATVDAPPATVPTAVIVPGIRASNVERFMSTLRASTGLATAYAVCRPEETEQRRAWKAVGAQVIEADADTFAQRINAGYVATTEPLVFVVGDDVRFRAGWLDQAQAIAGAGFGVVGTNDLGNPRVVSGEHATHFLVRRSYVEEQGGSWDGPGVLCHTGYQHWYVDDEIVTAAKQRGAWAMAIDSHVEHLHPEWGKGEPDEIYDLGVSFAEQDQALFRARFEANGGARDA